MFGQRVTFILFFRPFFILLFFVIILYQLRTEEMAINKIEHWKEEWGRDVLI